MNTKTKNLPAAHQAAGLPAELMEQMSEIAGLGVSSNPNDVGIPYWSILQDLSPQAKKRDEKYIDGAEPGMIFNTETQQLLDGNVGLDFIPCFYESAQVEWVPRSAGGGFVAKHPWDTPLTREVRLVSEGDKQNIRRLPSGNDLVETRYWYGFGRPHVENEEEAGQWDPSVVSMSSTMLKSSREWMGMVKRFRLPAGGEAPLFSHVYTLTTSLKSKNNNDWFVWSARDRRWVTSPELAAALDFHHQAAAGAVKVAEPDSAAADAGADAEEVI